MWRKKKFILPVLIAAVVAGSLGGVAFAQTENEDDAQPAARHEALLDRVCEIYEENTGAAIDSEALKDALAQAQSEMRTEALQNHLQNLVEQGQITQDEADQYLSWWKSRPDAPIGLGLRGPGGCPFRGPPMLPPE